jgi:hypothetical protein
LEDKARSDELEGGNFSSAQIPLRFRQITIQGPGKIGQQIIPHYVLSLHGSNITSEQRLAFGGNTFGVKSISKLSIEVLYKSSLQLKCNGYRYGPVCYQHATLNLSHHIVGSAPIQVDNNPPLYLTPFNTDVLRKSPVTPFIDQDEWRIVIFTNGYLGNDPNAPLKIHVDPSHFYPYLHSA